MANLLFSAQISEQALSQDTVETLIQLSAPANQRVKLVRWGVFFDGTQPRNEPIQVRLIRQESSGTADALSLVKLDNSLSETVRSTARYNFSVEPSGSSVIESYNIHPQQGIYVPYVLGQEILISGGGRLGIDCNAPNDVNARAFMICEE